MQDRLKGNRHHLPLQIAGSKTNHNMAMQELPHTAAASLLFFFLKMRSCFWVCDTMRASGQLSDNHLAAA